MSLAAPASGADLHRPPASPDDGRVGVPSSLVDPFTTGTLQVIADGAALMAGYRLVVIATAGDPEHLEVVAVAGSDEARARLGGHRIPRDAFVAELGAGGSSGRFQLLPGARLAAPLLATSGELIGVMWLEEPVDQRSSDPATYALVEQYAEQAARTVALAARRHDLGEQMRLVTAAREVARRASRELEIAALMEEICHPLVAGFQALGMWVHAFDADGGDQSSLYDGTDLLPDLAPEMAALATRIAEDAWREQRVSIVSTSRLRGRLMSPADVAQVRDFLEQTGVGSLLFIPMGAGPECLGSLILARALDDSAWSESEIEVALDLGHDLGRAILNARSFARERELVQRLQALDAYRTRLITTMSHELKSPLTAILANVELLEELDQQHPAAPRRLDAVARGTRRLVRVVDNLLLLARAGDPETPLEATRVDLGALIEEAADLRRPEALRTGVTIRVELPDGPLSVYGDPLELDLVVANLISNAVKYSPDGGAVTVVLSRQGHGVVLTCADEGIGMSQEDVARIFDEFFRSTDSLARAQPGTGLGLAIVDRIVRRHHGTIQVTSALGEGSTFRVELPALDLT